MSETLNMKTVETLNTVMQTQAIVRNFGKIHNKNPQNTIFIGRFNKETKQLEGKTININPFLKFRVKMKLKQTRIGGLNRYKAKMNFLEEINSKLVNRFKQIRAKESVFESIGKMQEISYCETKNDRTKPVFSKSLPYDVNPRIKFPSMFGTV